MIDYKEAKKHLINTLVDYGFAECKDKSCRKYRVFSNGSEVLLVTPNAQGEYTYYQNKSTVGDFGDTVQFIISRKLNKSIKLSADELQMIENEVKRVCGLTAIKDVQYNNVVRREPFDIETYNIERLNVNAVPHTIKGFFERRGIDHDQLAPFKTAIGVISSEKGYKMPLFYWQNKHGQILGAQKKYIYDGKCEKRFLPNTNRDDSLWMSSLENKSGLFVTEDPLDAIAHYQLFPAANLAYVCSGGTSTKNQRRMMSEICEQYMMPLILGNDNDLSGQFENFKIFMQHKNTEFQYTIDKQAQTATVTFDNQVLVWTKDDMYKYLSQQPNISVSMPQTKDWNDELKASNAGLLRNSTPPRDATPAPKVIPIVLNNDLML